VVPIQDCFENLVAFCVDDSIVRVLQEGGGQKLSCTVASHCKCRHVNAVIEYDRQRGGVGFAADDSDSSDDEGDDGVEDANDRRRHLGARYLNLIPG